MFALGSVFLMVGILPVIMGRGYGTVFLAVMGFLFIIWACSSFVSAKQISNIEE